MAGEPEARNPFPGERPSFLALLRREIQGSPPGELFFEKQD
jgi:hypothetical protein